MNTEKHGAIMCNHQFTKLSLFIVASIRLSLSPYPAALRLRTYVPQLWSLAGRQSPCSNAAPDREHTMNIPWTAGWMDGMDSYGALMIFKHA